MKERSREIYAKNVKKRESGITEYSSTQKNEDEHKISDDHSDMYCTYVKVTKPLKHRWHLKENLRRKLQLINIYVLTFLLSVGLFTIITYILYGYFMFVC